MNKIISLWMCMFVRFSVLFCFSFFFYFFGEIIPMLNITFRLKTNLCFLRFLFKCIGELAIVFMCTRRFNYMCAFFSVGFFALWLFSFTALSWSGCCFTETKFSFCVRLLLSHSCVQLLWRSSNRMNWSDKKRQNNSLFNVFLFLIGIKSTHKSQLNHINSFHRNQIDP